MKGGEEEGRGRKRRREGEGEETTDTHPSRGNIDREARGLHVGGPRTSLPSSLLRKSELSILFLDALIFLFT
jgi:hypothetical protein